MFGAAVRTVSVFRARLRMIRIAAVPAVRESIRTIGVGVRVQRTFRTGLGQTVATRDLAGKGLAKFKDERAFLASDIAVDFETLIGAPDGD